MTESGKPEKGKRLSYRFRLYPTAKQERYFNVNFGCCRYVYNHFLQARIEAYEKTKPTLRDGTPNPAFDPDAKPMTYYDTSRALTVLKKETVDEDGRCWLYDADADALFYALRNLDKAYQNFFRRVKRGEKPGFPKFKSRYSRQSFTVAACKIVDEGHVKLPKVGIVKAKVHREVKGKVVKATISRNAAGQYHVAINVKEADIQELPPLSDAVGVTLGISPLAVTSDGQVFDNPRARKKLARKLAREQRRLARKQKGSNNYRKQKVKVARVSLKIAEARSYGIHCMTRELVDSHGTIISRDMATQELMQRETVGKRKLTRAAKRKINDALADSGFHEINRQLAYKSEWAGRTFVLVPKDTLTAQVCADCGHREVTVAEDLKPEWTCSECGRVHSRKYNGAENVLEAGLDILDGVERSYVSKETAKARQEKKEKQKTPKPE